MRLVAIGVCLMTCVFACAQSIDQVYNRDTHENFKLKNVKIERTVIGPIVRTSTMLTFDNPYKKLTEASLWFGMPQAAALGGFAYYYGDEYVRGKLMDKAKAWFIYTAITSRNRDPGIMDQVTPTSYHAQIYPLKAGTDFRVRLYTIGMVEPGGQVTKLPEPTFDIAPDVPKESTVRVGRGRSEKVGSDFTLPLHAGPVEAVAQRFKDGRTYVAGIVKSESLQGGAVPTIKGLHDVKTVPLSDYATAFMGWAPRNRTLKASNNGTATSFRPQLIYKGSEAARLWAQQKLATWEEARPRDVLRFSMKYGVPSNMTALLAVPKQELELFHKKEREYQKVAAEQRRQEREEARRVRDWAKNHPSNWSHSSGGDPEIRVKLDGVERAYAVLPDGRVLSMRLADGYWGVNFDIPTDAPEGSYDVRVFGIKSDGSRVEKSVNYTVDRTPPTGQVTLRVVDGKLRIEVRSEPGLAEVSAWTEDGRKLVLKEEEPGVYRVELPDAKPIRLTILMVDRASNKGRLECSLPR